MKVETADYHSNYCCAFIYSIRGIRKFAVHTISVCDGSDWII